MGTTSQIIDPREVTKAALREVLRSLIHEMAEQAMDGRLRLAQGLAEVEEFRQTYRRACFQAGVDYEPLDTSMRFDRALTEYLVRRSERG